MISDELMLTEKNSIKVNSLVWLGIAREQPDPSTSTSTYGAQQLWYLDNSKSESHWGTLTAWAKDQSRLKLRPSTLTCDLLPVTPRQQTGQDSLN